VIAGPYAALQLAALGADVLKVEAPSGDPMRWRGGSDSDAAASGLSTHYQAHARGRSVVYLDWNSDAGIAALKTELATADIFICNLRAHVLPAINLGDDALREVFPHLIVCKLAGYSDQSDCAEWPAYDNTIQAASGSPAARPKAGVSAHRFLITQREWRLFRRSSPHSTTANARGAGR
jgi:CoA:oxalate CoA-transferase